MTEGPDKEQYTLYLARAQRAALKRIYNQTGMGVQSLIRLAIHTFLLSQDSTYRLNQQDEQAEPATEEAAK